MDLKELMRTTEVMAHLRLAETGQELTLRFPPGARPKRVTVSIAGFELEGEIRLQPIDGVPDSLCNVHLIMRAVDPHLAEWAESQRTERRSAPVPHRETVVVPEPKPEPKPEPTPEPAAEPEPVPAPAPAPATTQQHGGGKKNRQ